MSSNTVLARLVRAVGETVGYTYPEKPLEREMLGPSKVMDCLTPSISDKFFEIPQLVDLMEDVEGLDTVTQALINMHHEDNVKIMADFHAKMKTMFDEFYKGVSEACLAIDNKLTFTCRLLGHVDGSMAGLARRKLLQMFKGKARGGI